VWGRIPIPVPAVLLLLDTRFRLRQLENTFRLWKISQVIRVAILHLR